MDWRSERGLIAIVEMFAGCALLCWSIKNARLARRLLNSALTWQGAENLFLSVLGPDGEPMDFGPSLPMGRHGVALSLGTLARAHANGDLRLGTGGLIFRGTLLTALCSRDQVPEFTEFLKEFVLAHDMDIGPYAARRVLERETGMEPPVNGTTIVCRVCAARPEQRHHRACLEPGGPEAWRRLFGAEADLGGAQLPAVRFGRVSDDGRELVVTTPPDGRPDPERYAVPLGAGDQVAAARAVGWSVHGHIGPTLVMLPIPEPAAGAYVVRNSVGQVVGEGLTRDEAADCLRDYPGGSVSTEEADARSLVERDPE